MGSVGLFVCTIILEIQFFAWRAQHLRTPYGHLKGWSAAGYFYLTPPHGAVERWKPMVPSTHCPVGRSPSLGPDERFPSFAEETNKAIFRCLPRPWNKAEKIAVVNSFSSMWLEINSALAAEGQRPSQWQAQPEASTKKDKRDLWPSAMIATGRLDYLHTHTESRCDARRFTDASKAACGVQIYSSCGESRHRHSCKGNRRCLRFQTPDLQLQIQDEDLTYV